MIREVVVVNLIKSQNAHMLTSAAYLVYIFNWNLNIGHLVVQKKAIYRIKRPEAANP